VIARIPIRLRLALAFTLVTAIVLAASGVYLEARLRQSLDTGINHSLTAQATAVVALVKQSDTGLRQGGASVAGANELAQVLTLDGRVLDATPRLLGSPLLPIAQLHQAANAPHTFERSGVAGAAEPVRLLAVSTHAQGQRLVVVVGASLQDRTQALDALRTELVVGGPILILLLAAAGYVLAGAALRPVERMRRAAESLTGETTGELPLPTARDEVRRLGITLNALLGGLRESMARERRFLADASHELRTPLALLRTELELALRRPRTTTELEAAVRSAAVETDRLQRLADDLLVIARANDGALPLRRAPEPIGQLLERVAERYQPRAAVSQRRIIVHPDHHELAVDRLRLEQAVGNLIDNALTHGQGDVTVSNTLTPQGAAIHVEDQGQGFPREFIDHAFDRFTRADTARNAGGSGLGLSIVDVIAHAHGGHATATNTQRGSNVSITIPHAANAHPTSDQDDG
jgi:two-component system, OmpR family, sensor kinase